MLLISQLCLRTYYQPAIVSDMTRDTIVGEHENSARRIEEDLGTASGSFCFMVLKLGLLFLYVSSFVFLVSSEPQFSFTFALFLVVIKDSPVNEHLP